MPDGTLAPWTHHLDLSLPFSIVVDRTGERYLNESASYMEVGERMHERHRILRDSESSAIPSFVIFDGLHRKRYPWGTALPGVTPKAWLESGYMKKADTLAGLAAQCGIDAARLAKTVERWNGFCRSGVDADFNRGGRNDVSKTDVDLYGNPGHPEPCLQQDAYTFVVLVVFDPFGGDCFGQEGQAVILDCLLADLGEKLSASFE